MQIRYHRSFKKALSKQPKHVESKFYQSLELFVIDPHDYQLNNHSLTGQLRGWRSFNVTGDVRVHYVENEGGIVLMDIGTHSQLYG